MTDEFWLSIITNTPNFVGFVLLAFMQWRTQRWMQRYIERLSDVESDLEIIKRNARM